MSPLVFSFHVPRGCGDGIQILLKTPAPRTGGRSAGKGGAIHLVLFREMRDIADRNPVSRRLDDRSRSVLAESAAELYAADALALQPERLLLRLPYARDADDPGRTVMNRRPVRLDIEIAHSKRELVASQLQSSVD